MPIDHDGHPGNGHLNGAHEMRPEHSDPESDVQAADPSTLALSRVKVAAVLHGILERHWDNRNYAWAKRALAERYLGVTERTVRKWCSADKAAPLAVLDALPLELGQEIAGAIFAKRPGGQEPRATALLAKSLEQIAIIVSSGYVVDVPSLLPKLKQAQRSLDLLVHEIERRTHR